MTITYTIAIDRNDDGSFADSGDVMTPDVLEMRWRLGMAQPHDSMAAPIYAEILVRNPAGAYSPERTALLPGKRLRIQSYDGTTTRTHFTGFIGKIEPLPGNQGQRTTIIQVHGVEKELAENSVQLTPQVNARADQIIEAILKGCKLRFPMLDGYLIVGESGKNTLGRQLFGEAVTHSLETGKSIFAYTGDLWGAGLPADVAIRQAAENERGRFFINRDGAAVFYHRHHTLTDVTLKATFSDSMEGLDYSYGEEVVNQVEIRITPRRVGAVNTLLWALAEPQQLAPGTVKHIVARYQDANDNPVGALIVSRVHYLANTQPDNTGQAMTDYITVRLVQAGAAAARLEIEHSYSQPVYLTTLALYGTPLIQGDALVVTERDAYSQTYYGLNRLTFDLSALTSVEEAASIAQYELVRRSAPRGTIRALHTSTHRHPAETLALKLFDRITVTEAQTGHSGDYFIVAEEHHVDKGGTRHRVSWLLEPADDDRFFILDESLPDGTRYLMY